MPKTPEELAADLAEAIKRAETAETALAAAQNDADKWKALSQKNEKRAAENAEKAKKFDDIDKTEVERERARAEAAETALKEREEADAKAKADADAAEAAKKVRDEVATAKRIAPTLLRGSTKEELEAHADELIAAGLKPASGPSSDGQGENGEQVSTDGEPSVDDIVEGVIADK
jgi:membrane protein involved in colicin uptake